MKEIDVFAGELFEEAKRFLEKARDSGHDEERNACLHSALLLGISSLEAHVNAICEEMSERPGITIWDKSVLFEKECVFDKGEFQLSNKLKIYTLTDRILFLSKTFAMKGEQLDLTADWWSKLHLAIDVRNSLVHPKVKHVITYEHVKSAFEGILGTLDGVYVVIYDQHFPPLRRKLDSIMNF
jgi:hypothetical protein